MAFLSTLLYIIVFLICLSILIIVHELGHLSAAKIFKVYCVEFSCGMGPLLWKHKRKNGETQVSLRAIPFGGYVSMYGEGVELPEGVTVDPSRSLTGIKGWKRAIILVAGVTMNAILALVIFFFNNVAFEQQKFVYSNEISVVENSLAYDAGLRDLDILAFDESYDAPTDILLKDKGVITYQNGNTKDVGVLLSPYLSFKNPIYGVTLYSYENGHIVTTEVISFTEEMKSLEINLATKIKGEETPTSHLLTLGINEGKLDDLGIRIYVKSFRYSFGEAIKETFVDFGTSSTAIVDSLVGIFTGEVEVTQLSGVVGIGFEAKNILDNLGISNFIYLWGLISVNLAIVNLLPFPGLDGWQLLVLIVEGITRKKIPNKVQNIMSFIGLALLMVLMVAILFKDVWVYIIKGAICLWK